MSSQTTQRPVARRVFVIVGVYLVRALVVWMLLPLVSRDWGLPYLACLAGILAIDFALPHRWLLQQQQWERDDGGHE